MNCQPMKDRKSTDQKSIEWLESEQFESLRHTWSGWPRGSTYFWDAYTTRICSINISWFVANSANKAMVWKSPKLQYFFYLRITYKLNRINSKIQKEKITYTWIKRPFVFYFACVANIAHIFLFSRAIWNTFIVYVTVSIL